MGKLKHTSRGTAKMRSFRTSDGYIVIGLFPAVISSEPMPMTISILMTQKDRDINRYMME